MRTKENAGNSIKRAAKRKALTERVMNILFFTCGLLAVVSVVFITLYMVVTGGPAILKIGVADFLLGSEWSPENNVFLQTKLYLLNTIYFILCQGGKCCSVSYSAGIPADQRSGLS